MINQILQYFSRFFRNWRKILLCINLLKINWTWHTLDYQWLQKNYNSGQSNWGECSVYDVQEFFWYNLPRHFFVGVDDGLPIITSH